MSRLSLASAFALAALPTLGSLAACSSGPQPTDEVALSSSSEALSTSDAIDRAEQWVTAKLAYCQAPYGGSNWPQDTACSHYCSRTENKTWDPYRSDCSGLVSWAWGLPAPGRVTGEFAPFQTDITKAIPATDLRAGDAVNNSEHVMLFKAWTVAGKTATFIEEPGCSSSTPYAHEFTSNVTINGSSITVAWNGMTFTAIRYAALTLPDAPAEGTLDQAKCSGITGWSADPDDTSKPVNVELSFDAPTGQPGAGSMLVSAADNRADLCKAIGSCDHGFTAAMPVGVMDGKEHTVYAYGKDISNGSPTELKASGMKFTCAPPSMPAGIKRHVTDPAAFAAWKFDMLSDVERQPVSLVAALANGADLDPKPVVVIADDGSPSVWVVDGATRRHVTDEASLAAWRFSPEKWAAAKVNALPAGLDWPARPLLVLGEGQPAVYFVDADPAHPSGPGSSPTGGAADPSSTDPGAEGASGCATAGASGSPWALILALGLARATRRRRAR